MMEFIYNLIAAVRDEFGIYVQSHPFYINKNERHKAWKRIAAKLNKSKDECEKRWKLLQEEFSSILHNEAASSGSGAVEETSWPYFEEMSSQRKTRCKQENIPETVLLDESFQSADSLESSTKKTKIDHQKEIVVGFKNAWATLTNKIENQSSDDEVYAKNIVAMLKPFPMRHKDLMKARIFNLITVERMKLYEGSID